MPFKSIKENLESCMDEILFEAISKVFKDAIYVANSCNIRYIWVDSCKYGMAVWFTTVVANRRHYTRFSSRLTS
jgi:hypothetical protein